MTVKAQKSILHFSQVAAINPLIAYLESRGVVTAEYLLQAGLVPGWLENESNPVPKSIVIDSINAACRENGIEDWGLLVGQETSLQMLGEFGQILLNAASIHDYLKRGCRLIRSTSSGDYYWLVDETEALRFCQSVTGLEEQDTVQNYLYISLITINTIRQALDEPWCPTQITIPGMTAKTAAKLSALLPGTRFLRDGPHASFLVPHSVLHQPMPASPDQVHKDASESSAPPVPADFLSGICKLTEILIITGHPDIATAAEIIGLNKRAFQRRLAECGTNYSAVVAEARAAIAIRWIREGKQSLSEIAGSLGYSNPANFSRAFSRITGVSPSAYKTRYTA